MNKSQCWFLRFFATLVAVSVFVWNAHNILFTDWFMRIRNAVVSTTLVCCGRKVFSHMLCCPFITALSSIRFCWYNLFVPSILGSHISVCLPAKVSCSSQVWISSLALLRSFHWPCVYHYSLCTSNNTCVLYILHDWCPCCFFLSSISLISQQRVTFSNMC